jgi:large subunit ribosomal protein L25
METNLTAVLRDGRGKNEARRLRRSGQLPAVVYGGESVEGVAVSVDPKSLLKIFHSESGVNTIIVLSVDGDQASQVLVKEFQLEPISHELLHVDFFRLAMDKALTVTVPVVLHGEPVGVKQQGGLVDFIHREVQVECMPTEIPEHIDVDVSHLEIGDGVRLREVSSGVSWSPVSDPETLLVHVIAPKVEEEAEAEEAAEGAEAAPADGDAAEGAAKGKDDEGGSSSGS